MYTKKDVDQLMVKLDGLVAANDPESIARYVKDAAAVSNSPSIQDRLSKTDRRKVRLQLIIKRKYKPVGDMVCSLV